MSGEELFERRLAGVLQIGGQTRTVVGDLERLGHERRIGEQAGVPHGALQVRDVEMVVAAGQQFRVLLDQLADRQRVRRRRSLELVVVAAQVAVQFAVNVPQQDAGAGPHVGRVELLAHPVERRDRVAGAVAAEQPGVASLGVDAFEQREFDQFVGPFVVEDDRRQRSRIENLSPAGRRYIQASRSRPDSSSNSPTSRQAAR